MKKTLSILLAGAMMIGAMSVTAFAAAGDGTGEVTIEASTTTPEIPGPTDPTDPNKPNPEIPNGPNEGDGSLARFWNTDLAFKGGKVADIKNTARDLISTDDEGKNRAGIVVADTTMSDQGWKLTVGMSDFLIAEGEVGAGMRAIPGFTLTLTDGAVYGAVGADVKYNPEVKALTEADNTALNKDTLNSPKVIMTSNAVNTSPGYWAGSWKAELNIKDNALPGKAVANMKWTTTFGNVG